MLEVGTPRMHTARAGGHAGCCAWVPVSPGPCKRLAVPPPLLAALCAAALRALCMLGVLGALACRALPCAQAHMAEARTQLGEAPAAAERLMAERRALAEELQRSAELLNLID